MLAMNIGVPVFFKLVFVLLGTKEQGIAGSRGSVFQSTTPIHIPTNNVHGFPFLHILANACYLCFIFMIAF